jgi:hypothetical protein
VYQGSSLALLTILNHLQMTIPYGSDPLVGSLRKAYVSHQGKLPLLLQTIRSHFTKFHYKEALSVSLSYLQDILIDFDNSTRSSGFRSIASSQDQILRNMTYQFELCFQIILIQLMKGFTSIGWSPNELIQFILDFHKSTHPPRSLILSRQRKHLISHTSLYFLASSAFRHHQRPWSVITNVFRRLSKNRLKLVNPSRQASTGVRTVSISLYQRSLRKILEKLARQEDWNLLQSSGHRTSPLLNQWWKKMKIYSYPKRRFRDARTQKKRR